MRQASMLYVGAVAAIEQAVNGVLALDPETRARLGELTGKVVAIELKGLGTTLYLAPQHDRLRIMSHYDGPVDTYLRGTPVALLRMGQGDATRGLFSGEVRIEGDVELGQRVKRLVDQLDIDWEEHLARLTGDVVAHQVGNFVRGVAGWGRQAVDTLSRDTGEYLQEELGVLPLRSEVEGFLTEVDRLRNDIDRLEARLRHLRRTLDERDKQT